MLAAGSSPSPLTTSNIQDYSKSWGSRDSSHLTSLATPPRVSLRITHHSLEPLAPVRAAIRIPIASVAHVPDRRSPFAVRVVVLPTRISSAVPVWTPDLPLAWGVLLNSTRYAGARGARPRARTVPPDRHGGDRSCKTFGPCTTFGSKRNALHYVLKVQYVCSKRFASKTFGTSSNVKWPFSTRNQT